MDITGRIIYPVAPAEGETFSGVAVVVPAPNGVERGETRRLHGKNRRERRSRRSPLSNHPAWRSSC